MQNVSVKSFIIGMVLATFLCVVAFFTLTYEYRIPTPDGWDARFTLSSNAVTQNVRLSDSETGRTVLWTPGNAPVKVIEAKAIAPDRWQVVLEKVN